VLFLLNAAILWRAIASSTHDTHPQGEDIILQVVEILNGINDCCTFRLDNRVVKFIPIFYNFLTQHIRCFLRQAAVFYQMERETCDSGLRPDALKEVLAGSFCHNRDIRETLRKHNRLELTPSYLWLDRNYSVSVQARDIIDTTKGEYLSTDLPRIN